MPACPIAKLATLAHRLLCAAGGAGAALLVCYLAASYAPAWLHPGSVFGGTVWTLLFFLGSTALRPTALGVHRTVVHGIASRAHALASLCLRWLPLYALWAWPEACAGHVGALAHWGADWRLAVVLSHDSYALVSTGPPGIAVLTFADVAPLVHANPARACSPPRFPLILLQLSCTASGWLGQQVGHTSVGVCVCVWGGGCGGGGGFGFVQIRLIIVTLPHILRPFLHVAWM